MAKKGREPEGIYRQLEDHYYSFMDELDEAVPVYHWFVDPIEERKIPSFPVFCLVLLAVIAGVLLLAVPPQVTTVVVTVQFSDGSPVNGAKVTVLELDRQITFSTTSAGRAVLSGVPVGRQLLLKVEKEGVQSKSLSLESLPENGKINVVLQGPVVDGQLLPPDPSQSGIPSAARVMDALSSTELNASVLPGEFK